MWFTCLRTLTFHLLLSSILALAMTHFSPPTSAEELPIDARLLAMEQRRMEVIRDASAATIAIFDQAGGGGGSGVIISPDGYALTNFHVTAPCGDYLRCGLNDGRLYDAVIVGIDPTGDVALIKLLGRDDFPTAPFGDSDQVRAGQACFAAGNPFLLATDFQPTITWGIVSGVGRYQYPAKTLLEYSDCIQTDAAINPGNSGGPLFDENGQLIGINGRISVEKRGRINVGVGYAISINQIKKFLGHLHSGRIVDHATLGFTVASESDGNAVVTNILEASDAFRRGIRYGDQVLAIDGRRVTTANEVKNIVGTFPRGWRIPIELLRDGSRFRVNVRLAGLHGQEELLSMLEQPTETESPPRRDGRPKPEPEDEVPPHELPQEAMPQQTKSEIPDHVAAVFKRRRGFANYHFNRLHRERVFQDIQRQLGSADDEAPWLIAGSLATGGAFRIRLQEETSRMELPSGSWTLRPDLPLDDQRLPEGSGGLLPALHLLRQLVLLGPERFGEVTYVGTAPIPSQQGLFDVLSAIYESAELLIYTHPATGQLSAIEFFADSRSDPCEIYFQSDDAVQLRGFSVTFGDDPFAKFDIERFIRDFVE